MEVFAFVRFPQPKYTDPNSRVAYCVILYV